MTNKSSSGREILRPGMKNRMNFGGTCSYRLCTGLSPWNSKLGLVLEHNPELQTEEMETHSMPKCLHYSFSRAANGRTEPYLQSLPKLVSRILLTMLLGPNTSTMVNVMIAPPGSSHRPDNDNPACWISDNEQWQNFPINEYSKKTCAHCLPTRSAWKDLPRKSI